jgi:excisionase family DNA binding protein
MTRHGKQPLSLFFCGAVAANETTNRGNQLMPNNKPSSKRKAKGARQRFSTITPIDAGGALKLKDARFYLGGISVPTMHRLIKDGLLRPCRTLRHYLFSREELDRFLREGQTID